MSHTTTLSNVAIRDIQALNKAVSELQADGINCELVEKAVPRMYFSEQGEECDYVLKLKDGKYDVGFKYESKQDAYVPVLDTYNNHVGKQIGATCPMPGSPEGRAQHAMGRLMQGYAKNAAINSAVKNGYSVDQVTVDEEGNCHVLVGNIN